MQQKKCSPSRSSPMTGRQPSKQMREESETLVAAAEHEAVSRLPRPECLGVAAPPPRKSVNISGENCHTAETVKR